MREHGVYAYAHASEATPAIQGHPLAPAAWHGTMQRPLVLVLCMVQQWGGQKGCIGCFWYRLQIPGTNCTPNRL